MAAASSARPVAVADGACRTTTVAASTAIATPTVRTRAAAGLPRLAPRNESGCNRRVIVPPGEWFSKNPVPALTAGSTLNRYSKRYWGAPPSHRTKPAAVAAASIAHLLAHRTSRTSGPWISFNAIAAPSAAPPHQRPATHDHSHTAESPSSTRLT